MQRSLSLVEIAQLTKTGPTATARSSRNTPLRVGPVCDHNFVPHKILVTSPGRKEFPTKKCTLCNLWLCLQPNEIQEEAIADMGDWLG